MDTPVNMGNALMEMTVWGPLSNKVNQAISIVTSELKQAAGWMVGINRTNLLQTGSQGGHLGKGAIQSITQL